MDVDMSVKVCMCMCFSHAAVTGVFTVLHSFGVFIVPGEESADFDESSVPPHRTGS